jgi:hypothetical protein
VERKIEILMPHFLLGFSLAYFMGKGTPEAVWALAISSILWLLSVLIPRLCPLEKPTKLMAELNELNKKFEDECKFLGKNHDELKGIVHTNAEYSAKEFGTLKNVLQIKQMGR